MSILCSKELSVPWDNMEAVDGGWVVGEKWDGGEEVGVCAEGV